MWEHSYGHLTKPGSRDDPVNGTRNEALRMLSRGTEMTNGGTDKNYENKLGRGEWNLEIRCNLNPHLP